MTTKRPDRRRTALTARETECLAHAAGGKTNGEIAASLAISENTVRFHFKNILKKLGAHSRAEAVAKGWSPDSGNKTAPGKRT